jgi:hypothetical protein
MTYISGKNSQGLSSTPSKSVEMQITNTTGSTLLKFTPVYIAADGTYQKINVSIEAQALGCVGVLSEDINNGGTGKLAYNGTIEDVDTAADFGDILFVDKTGGITNARPSIGLGGFVAGDFVVQIGVIAKNPDNPANKDLIMNVQVIGQL